MANTIVSRNITDYQLVSIGIALVHQVLSLMDCTPELSTNPHLAKTIQLAQKWNDVFIDVYLSPRKGEQK